MIAAIHQPHFFPWLGYFDKMAKSDVFVLLDDVQMEKGSYMNRNRIMNLNGTIAYITISGDKHGYLAKRYCDISTTSPEVWIEKHKSQIKNAYGKSAFFNDIWSRIETVYSESEETICAYVVNSIMAIRDILGIDNKIIMSSSISVPNGAKKNDLVLEICKAIKADAYLSGNGARKYTDEDSYKEAGIVLRYQSFTHPEYSHKNATEFFPGLSVLDMLFSIGAEETRRLFWDAVNATNEFAGEE